jgi:hypothetical protein
MSALTDILDANFNEGLQGFSSSKVVQRAKRCVYLIGLLGEATIEEIAKEQGISQSYACALLNWLYWNNVVGRIAGDSRYAADRDLYVSTRRDGSLIPMDYFKEDK